MGSSQRALKRLIDLLLSGLALAGKDGRSFVLLKFRTWEERIEHDLWYVERWSLWVDLRVLFRTVWVVLKREGLYGPGGVNEVFGMEPPEERDG